MARNNWIDSSKVIDNKFLLFTKSKFLDVTGKDLNLLVDPATSWLKGKPIDLAEIDINNIKF